ncbi:hypothetical protein J3E64_001550 [Sphingobium sp. OAS761]|uniref:hypothetical protein n=1 Tax=Sphingobium sp. OAS761 TaxID=2817901 RepID=UPI0020A0B738|nr:hypothetical protein [Sphingobium sp. OAS761]MCP1469868.1 hypothetical protein [Sphingobium sp. OAS761]
MANQRPEDILARKLAHEGALARSHIPLDFQPWEREFRALQSAPPGYVLATAQEQVEPAMDIEFRDAEPETLDDAVNVESPTTQRPPVEFKADPTPSGGVLFSPLGMMVGDEPQEIPPGWNRGKRNTAPAATPDDSAATASSTATPIRKQEQAEQRAETAQRQDSGQTLYNLSALAARDGHVGNFRPIAGWAALVAQSKAEEEKKKKDRDFANEARAALDRYLAKLQSELEASKRKVEEYDRQLEANHELQRRLAAGEAFDPNNAEHVALARQAGIDPDKLANGNAPQVLADNEAETVRKRNEELKKQGEIERKIEHAEDLGERFDQHPDDPAIQREIQELTGTTEKVRTLAAGVSYTENQQVRERAADAVAASEGVAVHSVNSNLNADAISASAAIDLANSRADDFSFDAPPAEQYASAASAIEQTPIKPDVELKPAFTAATMAANDLLDTPEQRNGPAPQAQAATVKPA